MKAKGIFARFLIGVFALVCVFSLWMTSEYAFAEADSKPEIPVTNENLYDAAAGEIPGAMSGGACKASVDEAGSIRPFSADEEDYYNISTRLNRETEFWVNDGSGKYEKKSKSELSVYTKVKIRVDGFCSGGLEAWHGVGLVVKRGSQQATRIRLFNQFTQVLVQQTQDGMGENWAGSEDRYFDSGYTQPLQVGTEITLEVRTGVDSLSVWVNDFLAIDNSPITAKGEPAFSPYFINMSVTMFDIEQKFLEEVDLDHQEETQEIQIPEGNPNLLGCEGYETVVGSRISGNEGPNVSLENGVFTIDTAAFDGAFSLTNELLNQETFPVLTSDGLVPTAATDLSLYTTATVTFGPYHSSENWEGMGVVFGISADGSKYYKIRLAKDGTAYLMERTLAEPQSQSEIARSSFSGNTAEGSSLQIAILIEQGKISAWLDGSKIFEEVALNSATKPYFGAEFAQNAGSLSDFFMTFLQPVSIESTDEEIVIPESNPNLLHAEGYETVIGYRISGDEGSSVRLENGVFSIDNAAFNGAYSLTNELYREDAFDVIASSGKVLTPVEDLTLYTAATLNFGAYNSAETWEGLGILFGITKNGTKCYKVRLTKGGMAYLFERTIVEPQSEVEIARAAFFGDVSEGSTAKIEILNEQGVVSVWVNGYKVFRDVALGEQAIPFFGAEFAQNAGGVSDFFQSFIQPVSIEEAGSGEETYPPEPEKPPVNDAVIEPETEQNSGLWLIIAGGVLCVAAVGIGVVLLVMRNRSKKRGK